jgi:hypothetical protein
MTGASLAKKKTFYTFGFRQELHRIINDREMRDAIILIFANKQDLPEGRDSVG